MAGVRIGSFPWLLAGLFLLGWGQASSQLSRYAAADLAVAERRAGVRVDPGHSERIWSHLVKVPAG